MNPNRETVLSALRGVYGPKMNKDLVSMNMIQNLVIQPGGEISLKLVLSDDLQSAQERVAEDVKKALLSVSGVKKAQIQVLVQPKVTATESHRPPTGAQPIRGVRHVIAVSSGKGGVGKSSVAVNLAVSLARRGMRVGLMDADVYGPNVPTMMGVIGQPKIEHDPERGEIFVPPVAHQIRVMSMGFLIDPDQPLVWRGPMLHNIITQFCHKVNWGELDYLIVDMPPGTGDVQLSLSQLVPLSGVILVTTPQEVSVQDVRKAYVMFEKVRVPVLGIVENMSYFVCDAGKKYNLFGQGGGEAISQKFGIPLLAQLPLVMELREGGDVGRPITLRNPQSPVSEAFYALAAKVEQQINAQAGSEQDSIEIGSFH